jgi:hypothetical protein
VRSTTEVAAVEEAAEVEVAAFPPLPMAVAAAAVAFLRLRVFLRQPRVFLRRAPLPRILRLLSTHRRALH